MKLSVLGWAASSAEAGHHRRSGSCGSYGSYGSYGSSGSCGSYGSYGGYGSSGETCSYDKRLYGRSPQLVARGF